MPELPDLEVHSANLQKKLKDEVVERITVLRPKRVHASEEKLNSAFKGEKVKSVEREGKEMWLRIGDHTLGIHLMLNGELILCEGDEAARYVTAEISFKSGKRLAITDRQAWITVRLDPEPETVPDALAKEFTAEYLQDQLQRHKSKAVKTVLMDQDVVRGLGNAYTDEVLWTSRIHPASPAGKLSPEKVQELYKTIGEVLHESIKAIRKAHPGLTSGEPREHMSVHNPDREKSPTGAKIETTEIGGRKSYFTEEQVKY